MRSICCVVAITLVLMAAAAEGVRAADPATATAPHPLEAGRLIGKQAKVCCVAISADGKTAISGSIDNVICVWDVATFKCRYVLKGHTHRPTALSITADGTRAASSGGDGQVLVWDLVKGELIAKMKFDTQAYAVAISDNGKIVAGGTGMDEVKILDVDKEKVLGEITHEKDHINYLALSPDGKRLAVSARKRVNETREGGRYYYVPGPGHVEVYNTDNGQHVVAVKDVPRCEWLRFMPDGKRLLWASDPDGWGVADLATGESATRVRVHSGQILHPVVPDDASFMIHCGHEVRQILPGDRIDIQRRLPGLRENDAAAISADGSVLLIAGRGPTVGAAEGFEARSDGCVLVLNLGKEKPAKRYSADRILVNASGTIHTIIPPHNQAITFVDVAKGEQLPIGLMGGAIQPLVTSDGRWYVSMNQGKLASHSLVRDPRKVKYTQPLKLAGVPLIAALSPDDRWVIVGPTIGTVMPAPGRPVTPSAGMHVYDVTNSALVAAPLETGGTPATGIGFSADGQRAAMTFASLGDPKEFPASLQVWDIAAGKQLHRIVLDDRYHTPTISKREVLAAVRGKTIHRWNAATGQAMPSLQANDDIRTISFSPDGSRLLVSETTAAIRLLDADTGRTLHTIQLPEVKDVDVQYLTNGSAVAIVYRFDKSASVIPLTLP